MVTDKELLEMSESEFKKYSKEKAINRRSQLKNSGLNKKKIKSLKLKIKNSTKSRIALLKRIYEVKKNRVKVITDKSVFLR